MDTNTVAVAPKSEETASPASVNRAKAADQAKAAQEASEQSVSQQGGFHNDPDDPTNPNEVIERSRRNLRR